MRNFLIIIAGVVILNAIMLYSGAFAYVKDHFTSQPEVPHYSVTLEDTFRTTLEEEVDKQLGHPIEGYTPDMFMRVFPGLTATDFDGVQSSIGGYTIVDGKLQHHLDDTKLIHSAAKAINKDGMRTLLHNVANRLNVNLGASGTLTQIMHALWNK